MSEYSSPVLGLDCPNGCFKKLWEQAKQENMVTKCYPHVSFAPGNGRTVIGICKWSKRLGRHSSRCNGHYLSKRFAFCPHCGAKLEKEAHP